LLLKKAGALGAMNGAKLELMALPDFPMVQAGDDLAAIIADNITQAAMKLLNGDVIVLAQKIVSKAEGRMIDLASVVPSDRALQLAAEVSKDARLVEVILSESRRVVRSRPNVLIVEHRLGFIVANAGVDQSNVAVPGEREYALMLPHDPDATAKRLRAEIQKRFSADIAVIINDSFGRPWRQGTAGAAIGAAGLPALWDRRGELDLFGRPLRATIIGLADEIAAAASLLMGQADERRPVVILRGLRWSGPDTPAAALIRPEQEDLFR
jgi:coenzyme F420-0:L-glutamate ligase / coenzyme F420-1:gamma-L-glutamate ligase